MTSTPFADLLAMYLSLPILTTKLCRDWGSNTQPFACGANALGDFVTTAAEIFVLLNKNDIVKNDTTCKDGFQIGV